MDSVIVNLDISENENVGVLQWFAISKSIMVRPRQYFPVVPLPADVVASQMCFGKTCADATKWQDIMNMANWRAVTGEYYYAWGCSHRTATLSFTFAEAFEEVPAVRTYMHYFDECGFQNFQYSIKVTSVTTVGFVVQVYGYAMYGLKFHYVALSKDLNSKDTGL